MHRQQPPPCGRAAPAHLRSAWREVLADIRRQLDAGQPCRVVATSLIEAGVDVDFPAVLRAEAGLQAIAQAAGRCNREGRRAAEQSEVLVFAVDAKWKPPPELKQNIQALHETMRNQNGADLLGLQAIGRYFRHLYWQQGPQALDALALMKRFRDSALESLPFEAIARDFHMIESAMQPVIIAYDETARAALKALQHAPKVGALARCLQPYLVQVPAKGFEALRRAGAIVPVQAALWDEQFMVLTHEALYDAQTGLHWDDANFI